MRISCLAKTAAVGSLLLSAVCGSAQVIEPGDQISIQVLDDEALGLPAVEVQPDGRIYHPLLGEIQVSGKSRTVLAEKIKDLLKAELRDPHVVVNIVRKHDPPVAYVLGAVAKPGSFPIAGEGTVREMLVQAGGVTERAAPNRAVIISAGGERRVVDLSSSLSEASPGEVLRVAEGDCLYIPVRNAITIVGAVAKPGAVFLPDGATLADVLAAAGGLLPSADDGSIALLRDGSEQHLNRGETNAWSGFRDGDVVIVEAKVEQQATVLGEVKSQGTYPLGEDGTLVTLLARAGGVTPEADLARVKLLRKGSPSVLLDVRDLVLNGTSANNVPLQHEDTVVIPPRPAARVTVWGMVQKPGVYSLDERTGVRDVLDVLAEAGGLNEKAERRFVVIVRGADRVAHEVPLMTRDMVVSAEPLPQDAVLEDGDIVFVPPRKSKVDWREALTTLGVFSLILERFAP